MMMTNAAITAERGMTQTAVANPRPNAAHLVNIDIPKEFNQTVLEFLSKL